VRIRSARAAGADDAGEPDSAAAAGDDADLRLGEADLRGWVHHAQVAGEGELAAAAEGEAVDGGDPRLGAALDLAEARVQFDQPAADVVLGPALALFEVCAGAERFRAGTGDDHGPNFLFDRCLARLVRQLGDQRSREHVHLLLFVDRQDAGTATIFNP